MGESIFADTMADMNWTEIEKKGQAGVPVLFPLGVIEQHGPHLPLGTDIYFSYAVCKRIKVELEELGKDCLIAPPYYWGINHCTNAFPGTFSLKPETMKLVLLDIFSNLHQFGFDKIYCINEHGDTLHVQTILEAIKQANTDFQMEIKLVLEPYELPLYQLSGTEEYLLVDGAEYPNESFDEKEDAFEIHAGAYETAAMNYFYPGVPNKKLAETLPDYSLNNESMTQWLEGGEAARKVVPLGYAGNPAQFMEQAPTVEAIFDLLCKYIANYIATN